MDMSQYKGLFISESRLHLASFNELIAQMEEQPDNSANVDELFRHAHSMKGMAATMEFEAVATLAHAMENLLSAFREGTKTFSHSTAELLLESSDALSGIIDDIEAEKTDSYNHATLIERLHSSHSETATTPQPELNIKTDPTPPNKPHHQFRQSDSFSTVRVKTELLDHLVSITGELITVRHILEQFAKKTENPDLASPLHHLGSLVRELKDEVFQARMLPFSFIAERFPRLVRDLARKQGKEIDFSIEGGDSELDRAVLEEISEPLMHLLRNAVDHGLETADERVASGKTYNGKLKLSILRNKDQIEIVLSDDGRGMNTEVLIAKAIAKGIITSAKASLLTTPEIFLLTCAPGFSTAERVTDISGRGVGMDVVKTAIHKLGGGLSINSKFGEGSTFTLQIPMTVSIIHALMVRCGDITVAVPITTVDRTLELTRHDIYNHAGRNVCDVDGEQIPLKNLNRLFGEPLPQRKGDSIPALVIKTGGVPVVLLTDSIKGEQEIFVKKLGAPLSSMKWCSGGTIMGDGTVVFVLDTSVVTS